MLTPFSRNRAAKGRQIGLRLVLAGFLVRALIPIGFMPAPLAAGGPIMLCHGGLAGAFFQALTEQSRDNAAHGHTADDSAMDHHAQSDHASDTDPTQEFSAWDHCPTGATASAAALAPGFSISLLALAHAQPDPELHVGTPATPLKSYQARAPPPNLTRLLA